MPDFVVKTFLSLDSDDLQGKVLFTAFGIIFIYLCYMATQLLLPLFRAKYIPTRQKKIYSWGVVSILSFIFLSMIREKFFPAIDNDMFILICSTIIVIGCLYFLLEKQHE